MGHERLLCLAELGYKVGLCTPRLRALTFLLYNPLPQDMGARMGMYVWGRLEALEEEIETVMCG